MISPLTIENKKDEDFEIEDPLKLDLDFFDEEFGSIVKQAYEDILETSSTSTLTSTNKISSTTDSSSYLLNYDGFQYDVGMNSSLSLLSSENDKDITKNSVGYIQCNSNIQICEVNDIIMVL